MADTPYVATFERPETWETANGVKWTDREFHLSFWAGNRRIYPNLKLDVMQEDMGGLEQPLSDANTDITFTLQFSGETIPVTASFKRPQEFKRPQDNYWWSQYVAHLPYQLQAGKRYFVTKINVFAIMKSAQSVPADCERFMRKLGQQVTKSLRPNTNVNATRLSSV